MLLTESTCRVVLDNFTISTGLDGTRIIHILILIKAILIKAILYHT